jgi:hypothetical protein
MDRPVLIALRMRYHLGALLLAVFGGASSTPCHKRAFSRNGPFEVRSI